MPGSDDQFPDEVDRSAGVLYCAFRRRHRDLSAEGIMYEILMYKFQAAAQVRLCPYEKARRQYSRRVDQMVE